MSFTLLDTTLLSNFAQVRRPDLLRESVRPGRGDHAGRYGGTAHRRGIGNGANLRLELVADAGADPGRAEAGSRPGAAARSRRGRVPGCRPGTSWPLSLSNCRSPMTLSSRIWLMGASSAFPWPGRGACRRQRRPSGATSSSSAAGWACISRTSMKTSAQRGCCSAFLPDRARPGSAQAVALDRP